MEENDQQKMQELYVELQMLNKQLKHLRQQEELLDQQTIEMAQATVGLDDFAMAKEGTEMFVPLSSGIFAKAKIADTKYLLMNVGAGVCVSKDIASAKLLMQVQLEESRKLSEKISIQVERFSKKATQVQRQLQALLPADE